MSLSPYFLAGSVLALAGCATTAPRASLPAVQSQLEARCQAPAAWPIGPDEVAQADSDVRELLARDLTPDTVVRLALLNNRSLRATFEELGLSQADLAAATRLPNPTLSAQLRWPSDRPRGPNAEFALTAPLLEAILLPLRRRVAEDQLAQAQSRIAHEVLALAAEARAAAFGVLAQQEIRVRLGEFAQGHAAAADLAQRQYDAGNISRLDLAEFQAPAQQAQLELIHAQAEGQAARERLNRVLGLAGDQTGWHLIGTLPEPPASDPDPGSLESLALSQRFDLAAARRQVAIAAAALRLRQRTRYLPGTVDLGVDTEREPAGSRVTGPRLDLQLPLFDQGQPEIARLAARLRQAQDRADALAADIGSEVRSARHALGAARATADYLRLHMLPQRQLILREMLLHYNAMQKSPYELLLAQSQLQITERLSIDARRDTWLAFIELERALGGRLPSSNP